MKKVKKVLDKSRSLWYTTQAVLRRVHHPKATAKTVRTIQGNSSAGRAAVSKTACRGFESFFPCQFSGAFGKLIKRNFRGFSSFGRARPCQGRGGGFEPRNPLQWLCATTRCVCESFTVRKTKQNNLTVLSQARPIHGGLAQLGEHLPYKQRVTGSSPVPSTITVR